MSLSQDVGITGQKNKVLLTAFSGTSAELLMKGEEQSGPYTVLMLPNDKRKDSKLLIEQLEREMYAYVISFGQRPNIKDKVHIEMTARKGDGHIDATFDCEALKQAFAQSGLVSKLSFHAGNSFCNELYWNGLRYIAENKPGTKMVFVHVPFVKNISDVEEFRLKIFKGLECFCF